MKTFILDGYKGRPRRWERLRKRIEAETGPCAVWEYDDSGRTPIGELAEQFLFTLDRQNGPVNLIGYSMGGLVLRAALATQPERRVRRLITLNTPHYGTFAACAVTGLPAVRQMRPGSDFLRELDAAGCPHPALALWCPGDLVVIPGHHAKWKQAGETVCCPIPAHIGPIYSPFIHRRILEFLNRPGPREGVREKSRVADNCRQPVPRP